MSNQSDDINSNETINTGAGKGGWLGEEVAKLRAHLEELRGKAFGPEEVVQGWPQYGLYINRDGVASGVFWADVRSLEGWRGADLYTNGKGEEAVLYPAEKARLETVNQMEGVIRNFSVILAMTEGATTEGGLN